MHERLTISESKGTFHKDFPYVIPAIYRKVIDEYLVELNLLKNQSSFKEDGVFAYGLIKSFKKFMQGYEPESHVDMIFQSLCKSCNIDYKRIEELSEKVCEFIQKGYLNSLFEKTSTTDTLSESDTEVNKLLKPGDYYTRMHAIGIYEMMSKSHDNNNEQDLNNLLNFAQKIGLNKSRVDKDANQYKGNIERIKEAFELLKASKEKKA